MVGDLSSGNVTSLALNSNWLNADITPTVTNASNLSVFNTSTYGWAGYGYWYPYYQPLIQTITSVDHRPIRLTMAEVERLRVAAKKDKELKATLAKFTDLIEVAVEF